MEKSKKVAPKPALNKPVVIRSLHKDRVKEITKP